MIGAKLDGEAQRKKHISTRHPKQAATRSIFALAKARRRKSSSSILEEGKHIGCMRRMPEILRL